MGFLKIFTRSFNKSQNENVKLQSTKSRHNGSVRENSQHTMNPYNNTQTTHSHFEQYDLNSLGNGKKVSKNSVQSGQRLNSISGENRRAVNSQAIENIANRKHKENSNNLHDLHYRAVYDEQNKNKRRSEKEDRAKVHKSGDQAKLSNNISRDFQKNSQAFSNLKSDPLYDGRNVNVAKCLNQQGSSNGCVSNPTGYHQNLNNYDYSVHKCVDHNVSYAEEATVLNRQGTWSGTKRKESRNQVFSQNSVNHKGYYNKAENQRTLLSKTVHNSNLDSYHKNHSGTSYQPGVSLNTSNTKQVRSENYSNKTQANFYKNPQTHQNPNSGPHFYNNYATQTKSLNQKKTYSAAVSNSTNAKRTCSKNATNYGRYVDKSVGQAKSSHKSNSRSYYNDGYAEDATVLNQQGTCSGITSANQVFSQNSINYKRYLNKPEKQTKLMTKTFRETIPNSHSDSYLNNSSAVLYQPGVISNTANKKQVCSENYLNKTQANCHKNSRTFQDTNSGRLSYGNYTTETRNLNQKETYSGIISNLANTKQALSKNAKNHGHYVDKKVQTFSNSDSEIFPTVANFLKQECATTGTVPNSAFTSKFLFENELLNVYESQALALADFSEQIRNNYSSELSDAKKKNLVPGGNGKNTNKGRNKTETNDIMTSKKLKLNSNTNYSSNYRTEDGQNMFGTNFDQNPIHVNEDIENENKKSNDNVAKIDQKEETIKDSKYTYTNMEINLSIFSNIDKAKEVNKESEEQILKFLEETKKIAEGFEANVNEFSAKMSSIEYYVIDENLSKIISSLDEISCRSNEKLLSFKIGIINYINSLYAILDSRVIE